MRTLALGGGALVLASATPAAAFEGAVPAGANDTSSVAICDAASGACGLRCTGVLVAPRVVLTARHCVTSRSTNRPNCAEDVEGELVTPASRLGVVAGGDVAGRPSAFVANIVVPPASAPCGHDLALLTLDVALPGIAAADVHVGDFPSAVDVEGYGASNVDGSGAGIRRALDASGVTCRGDARCSAPGGTRLVASEVLIEARACPGDSGGGAFTANVRPRAVAGILSRSIDDGACGRGVYTALDDNLLWLARGVRAVADADHIAPPTWVARAEARGNRRGDQLGAMCNDDADCASRQCRSQDGDRSFTCALPCDDSCACLQTSRGPACFAPRETAGCDACSTPGGAARTGLRPEFTVGLLSALVAVGRIVKSVRTPRRRSTGARVGGSDILARHGR